jgi:alpha-1,6-mannosyltransferase
VRPRGALLAAGAVALLVAGCVACAWAEGAPLVPADAGRADGGSLGRLFLALLAAAFAVYLGALALVRRRAPTLKAVVLAAVVIQLVPLAGPLLLSTDAWTYWEYGRIAAVHDANPYVDTPSDFPADPAYDDAGAAWRDTTSVYGPVFTLLSEAVAEVSGSSEDAAAWIFKMLAAGGVLACVLLAARLARDRPAAAALVGWNPLLAIHFAGGGHNDSLMIALVLAALVLAAIGRRGAAAVAWVLAVFVKWVPIVFFGLRAVAARASGRRVSHLAFAVAALAVALVATWRYGLDWLRAFGPLARNAEGQTSYALPHRLEQLGLPQALALTLAGTVLVLGLAWLAREAHRGQVFLGRAGCLLLATTPWLAPWYTIWALPLAAAEDDRRAQLVALGFCVYLLPQTIPL